MSPSSPPEAPVAVVVATRNRAEELITTLRRLAALPERPRLVVVDNASTDGTPARVRAACPEAEVLALPRNLGAGARTVGVRHVDAPYVAFSDDDSWWAPGALARAVSAMRRHPALGLLAARVLVGPEQREDPVCAAMAASPLPRDPALPGPPVLGFVACGAVVRRSAFLAAGGFRSRFGIGGEEEPLALGLAALGWGLAYVDEVVAHHHPSPVRDPAGRRRRQVRNALWTAWLGLPARDALRRSGQLVRPALRAADRDVGAGALQALAGAAWVRSERRPAPPPVARAARLLHAG